MFLCCLEGSKEQLCEGARKRRKKEKGGQCRTWTTRARRTTKNQPTNYINLTQTTSCATYNNLRLATTMPWYSSTKWAYMLLKSIDLTQVYCCRCSATTTVPVTTSMFDDKDVDVVLDAAGERPLFSCQVTCTSISIRLAPTMETRRRHRTSGGQRS
jgi:hypothetical protein